VDDMHWLMEPQVWAGLLTLTALEIVLGIDNLVFVAVLVARARAAHRTMARRLGLGLALGMRLILLSGISWIAHLTHPALVAAGHEFSWRDLILIGGGLFLVYKGTVEIHARVEREPHAAPTAVPHSALAAIVMQIALLDIVFSLDSVITAVSNFLRSRSRMCQHVPAAARRFHHMRRTAIALGILEAA
jgi:predicted tellurium resistance membrane protein TerC